MAFYYVKSGGTATGDGGRTTTQRTGAWSSTASEYYDSLNDAFVQSTTVPDDGDFVLCSDLHNKTGANRFFTGNLSVSGAGVQIISVDDTNQENYKPGAQEARTENIASAYAGNGLMAGMDYSSNTSVTLLSTIANNLARRFIYLDCVLSNSVGDVFQQLLDGHFITFINTDVDTAAPNTAGNGAKLQWLGGVTISTGPIFEWAAVNGGKSIYVEGVDLSAVTDLIDGAAGAAADDVTTIEFVKCRLNASVTLPADGDLVLPQHIFIMRACDDSTGGDTFRFHYQTGTGKAVNNESTFVTNEKAWGEPESPEKRSSVAVTTKANCSHILPFVFDFPLAQEYIDLSDAAENVLRLPVLSELTLTDTEIAAFMMYPDDTTAVTPVWITSGKVVSPTGSPEQRNYGIDPLAAGTELPTQSPETEWTIGGGSPIPNKYYLELDTSGIAGQAQAVSIRIEVYRASIAAGELFIATEFEKF